ncbi:hypothetical protein NDU88_006428 [Pleurodeles waltl]|uniref:KRAB domain-containing protein n=1 Tax=Pleurodeles waltl TaxID=8319 RepID=A0AAV7RN07_PLEWA|nr:hypothetical protein NDU88_006428 [Pleurodeles waltl]
MVTKVQLDPLPTLERTGRLLLTFDLENLSLIRSTPNFDKMPVTFHDAAVHFSAEEWTQLHEWQKELYRKVMKEIHQALISLGPIIAATVFSLQAKENGDLCIVDIQDSERQQCGNPSASAVISTSSPIPFWVTTEENDCLKGSQDSDRLESSGNLSPG